MAKTFTPKRVAIAQLVENPRNPRIHPQEQIDALRASFKKFGQAGPVLVRKENWMIIAGHGLTRAMKAEGAKEIDVLFWDCDQKTADSFMVADNRLPAGAQDDFARIAEILKEQGENDLEALGFDADALAALFEEKGEQITVEEIETGPVKARFFITIRGPLKEQAKALTRLKKAMEDLPEVSVDQGTGID